LPFGPSLCRQTSGKRWKFISEQLGEANPRTPAMVRNRYLRIKRGRELTEQGQSKNRCGQCGELKRGHVCLAPRAQVALPGQAMGQLQARKLRMQDGIDMDRCAPISPTGSPASRTLNLGSTEPLTCVSSDSGLLMSGMGNPAMSLMSPTGTLSEMRSPGMPSLSTNPAPAGPRPQSSSFEMLLNAAEMRTHQVPKPAHPSNMMKILADTPNTPNGDFPFASYSRRDLPDVPSPADLARASGVATDASRSDAAAEQAAAEQKLLRSTESLAPSSSLTDSPSMIDELSAAPALVVGASS
jgi:hypothetical protein